MPLEDDHRVGTRFEDSSCFKPIALVDFDELASLIFCPPHPQIETAQLDVLARLNKQGATHYLNNRRPTFTGVSESDVRSFDGDWNYANIFRDVWDTVLSVSSDSPMTLPLAARLDFTVFKVTESSKEHRVNASQPDACFLLNSHQRAGSHISSLAPFTPAIESYDRRDSVNFEPSLSCSPTACDNDYWCNLVMPMLFNREFDSELAHEAQRQVSRIRPSSYSDKRELKWTTSEPV